MRKLKNEELGRIDVEAFKNSEKLPLILILDDIRSMHNVGSAFRTCDAFRIEKIILTGITPRPPHRDINKVALGATESVSWEYHENLNDVINDLQSGDYNIVSIEQADESTYLRDFRPEKGKKYAFIFGNEVFGVKDEVVRNSDLVLEIPQYGTKHSLNVSVSIGVVLWDYFTKMSPNQDFN